MALKMKGCMSIVNRISNDDAEALLQRLDAYVADGLPPERAQTLAVQDTLAELEAEREEVLGVIREQHPDAFAVVDDTPDATTSESADATSAAEEPVATDSSTENPTPTAPTEEPAVAATAPPAPSSPQKSAPPPVIVGDTGRKYTPEQRAMFRNTGREVTKKSVIDRVKELRSNLAKTIAQGLFDQFAPLQTLVDRQAYFLARLSKGSAGAFEAMLHHGKLKITDGVYDADQTGGFIDRVGRPLHGELEDFLWWVAGHRAERLTKEGRENLFSAEDIGAAKSLASGETTFDYELQHGPRKGEKTRDRAAIYRDSLKTFDEFNRNALDIAEQSGLIDPEARAIWQNEFYVPFYRQADQDGGFVGSRLKSGLVRQRAYKELKGGSDKLNSDLLANVLQNWAHLIDASAKNRAAKAALESAEKMQVAEAVPQGTKGAVWYADGGDKKHYLVNDPFIMEAITALEYSSLKGSVFEYMNTAKRWLTTGVTASPVFKVSNLIRDSISAIGISPLSGNVAKNLVEGYKASAKDSQTYVSALASGGLIRFGTMLEGRASEQTRRLIDRGVDQATILDDPNKVKAFFNRYIRPGVDAYNEIGNRGEEINRAALYSQLVAKGMSHAEASFAARDLMDFSMSGSWQAVRFFTQVVPFLNARLQGLYRLGKGAKENPARFAAVTGTVALFSLALAAAYGDDEDWKKREDWDRDTYWWFKFGDTAFRIPKPFEIGAIGTLAERSFELWSEPEMTGPRFRERMVKMFTDTFAMNPVPQLLKPVLDVYANKDSFTGRPIETMSMERLQSDYRFTSRTSLAARAASTALNTASQGALGKDSLSPVQIDYMVRAYFGWLGATAVSTADLITRPLTDEPIRPSPDVWRKATGGFLRDLDGEASRYVTHMYDQATAIEKAYGTWRQLQKEGKIDEATRYLTDNREAIAKYKAVTRVKAAESKLNETIRAIERSGLDPDVKRERINAIQQRKSDIAKLVY